jgi:hypothetical protein
MNESVPVEEGDVPPAVWPEDREEVEMPVGGESFYKPFVWGDDAIISSGDVQGGISVIYDNDFNQYAVRCTTHNGAARRGLKVYTSADNGATWEWIKWFTSAHEFKYPQLFVCQSGSIQYLYIFYHHSLSEGRVRLYACDLDEPYSMVRWLTVADAGAGDSITYYSACTSIYGTWLTMVYEVHESGDATPDVRSVRSTNQGSTWFNDRIVDYDGQHPDVAYGYSGYVYTVYATTSGGDYDIEFKRSTNYGDTWGGTTRLINDSFDDDYPKVAALHTLPANSAYVWVTFSHDYANSGNLDVRYVYSTNSGASWSSYINLANSSTYSEMAADLVCWHLSEYSIMHVSYLKYRLISIFPFRYTADIYTAWTSSSDPTDWQDLTEISDHRSAVSEDARNVCQGTIMPCIFVALAGYVYAGSGITFGYDDLYWDGFCYTDVEEEGEGEARPSEFSLHDNYPNPFNPETVIGYSIPEACLVRLEIFNVLGQRIRTLVEEEQAAGTSEVVWDGKDETGDQVASGVYFYKLKAEDFSQTKKMVLIR